MSTPRLRWLVRQEMQFDEYGAPAGHTEVKVLQYAIERAEPSAEYGFTVFCLYWYDVPTVFDD